MSTTNGVAFLSPALSAAARRPSVTTPNVYPTHRMRLCCALCLCAVIASRATMPGPSVSKFTRACIQREIKQLHKNVPENVRALPNDNNILEINYVIHGSKDTPYAGGWYHGVVRTVVFARVYTQPNTVHSFCSLQTIPCAHLPSRCSRPTAGSKSTSGFVSVCRVCRCRAPVFFSRLTLRGD